MNRPLLARLQSASPVDTVGAGHPGQRGHDTAEGIVRALQLNGRAHRGGARPTHINSPGCRRLSASPAAVVVEFSHTCR